MFTTIDITKFGLYKNFTWPGNLKPFSRVNILYGRNYSGKTTLSRVFDCVAQGELHKDYKDAKFGLTDDGQHTVTPVTRESGGQELLYTIHAFMCLKNVCKWGNKLCWMIAS